MECVQVGGRARWILWRTTTGDCCCTGKRYDRSFSSTWAKQKEFAVFVAHPSPVVCSKVSNDIPSSGFQLCPKTSFFLHL